MLEKKVSDQLYKDSSEEVDLELPEQLCEDNSEELELTPQPSEEALSFPGEQSEMDEEHRNAEIREESTELAEDVRSYRSQRDQYARDDDLCKVPREELRWLCEDLSISQNAQYPRENDLFNLSGEALNWSREELNCFFKDLFISQKDQYLEEKAANSFMGKIGYSFTTDDVQYAQEGRTGHPTYCEMGDYLMLDRQNLIEIIRFNQHFPKLISEIRIERLGKLEQELNKFFEILNALGPTEVLFFWIGGLHNMVQHKNFMSYTQKNNEEFLISLFVLLNSTSKTSVQLILDQTVYRSSKQALDCLKKIFSQRLKINFIEDECRKTFNTASEEEKARKHLADIFFDKNKLQGKIMDQALKGSPVQVSDLWRLYWALDNFSKEEKKFKIYMDHDTFLSIHSKDSVFSNSLRMPKEFLENFMARPPTKSDIVVSYNLTPEAAIAFAEEIDHKLNTKVYSAFLEHRKNRTMIKSEQEYKNSIMKI
ncbi:MAG: hypothetical protein BGO07_00415 [Alphaproteobacteria bacterium 40-19]|nr:MAG: hypothetical protein BGO07_00415 [Alphaproteobacteria bacterium 40-19]